MVGWSCCVAIIALLWCLNWKLFLATAVGISLMSLCYLVQNPHWQRYCKKWQSYLVGSNRQLILAVGSGAVGSFCTYLAASVWTDAENQWLATGSILQGLVSLSTLSALLWSMRQKKGNTVEAKLNSLLADLSDREPLKRLVAIRQLTRMLVTNSLSSEHYSQSIEYFYLMLSEPQLPVIKNALLESLELLDAKKTTKITEKETRVPINFRHTLQSIKTLQD